MKKLGSGTGGRLVVVGTGLGGLSAALRGHDLGLDVVLLEKAHEVGGATAYSGGQVWVPGNHVARAAGIPDSVENGSTYLRSIADEDPHLLVDAAADAWLGNAPRAAGWIEAATELRWRTIPRYADYYYPDAPGSLSEGRYLTGGPIQRAAGARSTTAILASPHFPDGVTYEEMFTAKDRAALEALAVERRESGVTSFGRGIVAALMEAVRRRGIDLRMGCRVTELLSEEAWVTGVRYTDAHGDGEVRGSVVLATGSYDWDPDRVLDLSGLPWHHSGSIAPRTLEGDGLDLAQRAGADLVYFPPRYAPHVPGYRLPGPREEYRPCMECALPHTFIVDRSGRRFCDDSFYPQIVRAAHQGNGAVANLPFFMVWDDQHRRKYGLGPTPPGGRYPEGLVTSSDSLRGLARGLGVDPDGLEATAIDFNEHAIRGEDPRFGRGTRASVRRFRGDATHDPNPNLGPVVEPPFHGMALRMVATGIAAVGIRADASGRAVTPEGEPVPGLYAVGACTAMTSSGSGYNSGFSLSRALTFGVLAAEAAAGWRVAEVSSPQVSPRVGRS